MSSDLKQRRRDKRYRTDLTIRTRMGGKPIELEVEDVSFRGMFICSQQPLPVRGLIKIEANLPPNGTPFATHGMVVGHVAPEAAVGGPIALVEDGDVVSIDALDNRLDLEVSDEVLAERRARWTPPESRWRTGVLAKYARLVRSASEGAVTD